MIRIFLALLLFCSVASAFGQERTLQLVSPDVLWPQDSIPEKAGERIVIWASNMQAYWVVVLIDMPYEQARERVRELADAAFGIELEREMISNTHVEKPVDPHLPIEPLFGDGFSDFRAIGVPVTAAREYRIETNQYNTHVRWWKSYSKSEWRIIDGSRLFGKTGALVVVSRTDHSREWVWMHPGIPMPFTVVGDTKLVTDKETTLIATLLKNAGDPPACYFVPNIVYNTNGVLNVMMAIREAAKELK